MGTYNEDLEDSINSVPEDYVVAQENIEREDIADMNEREDIADMNDRIDFSME